MILNILSAITKPVTSLIDYFSLSKEVSAKTRDIKIQGACDITKAKIGVELAKLDARTKEVANVEDNDTAYDMQVLRNRRDSIIDEIIIVAFLLLFTLHFIPSMQPYMLQGWKAMGYDGVPWWIEFGALGILVSTLGLMRLFRMFVNMPNKVDLKKKDLF